MGKVIPFPAPEPKEYRLVCQCAHDSVLVPIVRLREDLEAIELIALECEECLRSYIVVDGFVLFDD